MTNTIDPGWLLPSLQPAQREPKHVLGKDDFLKLLLVELQNQDPLSPVNEREMMAQLTQFSSLEQLMGIRESLETMTGMARNQHRLAFSHMIGKVVTWEKYSETGEEWIRDTGKIVAIEFKMNGPVFILEDGTELTGDEILEIREADHEVEHPLQEASRLIGYSVQAERDGNLITGTIQSVAWKDGTIVYELQNEDGTQIRAGEIVKISIGKSE